MPVPVSVAVAVVMAVAVVAILVQFLLIKEPHVSSFIVLMVIQAESLPPLISFC